MSYAICNSDTRLLDLVAAAVERGDGVNPDEDVPDIRYEAGSGPPSARTRFKRASMPVPSGRCAGRQQPQHPTSGPNLGGHKAVRRKESIGHHKQRRGVRGGVADLTATHVAALIDSASAVHSEASTASLWPDNGYVNSSKRKRSAAMPQSSKKARISAPPALGASPVIIGQPQVRGAETLEDPGPAAVQALKDAGYQILKASTESAGIVLDRDGIISAGRARRPQGSEWDTITTGLDAALKKLHIALDDQEARRGKGVNRWDGVFKHIFWGLSFGGGQREPGYLAVKNKYHPALQEFTENPAVRAFSKHIRRTMETWMPKVLEECDALAAALSSWQPDMLPAYPGLPLFAESANTGDQAVAPDHYDMFNAIDKFCFVIPTGSYNPTTHGLIVLHKLKVAIEAAPGDVVFFPSALIRHGNTPIAHSAIRRSWTLFTAGALYRWWDAGFRTLSSMSTSEKKRFKEHAQVKLQERMSQHMTLDQLRAYRAKE